MRRSLQTVILYEAVRRNQHKIRVPCNGELQQCTLTRTALLPASESLRRKRFTSFEAFSEKDRLHRHGKRLG